MLATRDSFGIQLEKSGEINQNILVLSADLAKATKITGFANKFPDRFFEVGIAECNMVGVASGLSQYGYRVVLASFASFLTGKYDTIRVSIAYANAPVILVGTHAGLAIGRDGVTQMGLEDVNLMRGLPNMNVLQPATPIETRKMVKYLLESKEISPTYLRLGRQPVTEVFNDQYRFIPQRAQVIKEGSEGAIFSSGCLLPDILQVANDLESNYKISCAVVNVHTLKPLDVETVLEYNDKCQVLFSVEDHSIIGGLGSAIAETVAEKPMAQLKRIGLQDCFPESGVPKDLWNKYGLSQSKIKAAILEVFNANK